MLDESRIKVDVSASTAVFFQTTVHSDTWWRVVLKNAAAVAKTSTNSLNKKLHYDEFI